MDKETIRHIKSQFFALRNGDIAERLRKAGSPYKIIFGLLVPQMEQIASSVGSSSELADELWNNTSTRESRLLATMVYPRGEFTSAKAQEWIATADTKELVDMLCFRLVRNLDEAESLIPLYATNSNDLLRYFALRLAMNLLILRRISNIDTLHATVKKEVDKDCVTTKLLSHQLLDEIEFLRGIRS